MSELAGQMTLFNEPPLKITKPIRLIELFAGIGAQAKALENLGVNFEHYRICEFDRFAVASYNAVHGTHFQASDITKIHADDLAVVDTDKFCYIMTYSFPCQDLSTAGKQRGMTKGSGTRSGLLWEVERLLGEMNELPQILLMENVPAVIGTKNKFDFDTWCDFLRYIGYTNMYSILNAKDYGIPQNRARCFMVSFLGNFDFKFPAPMPLTLKLKDMLEVEVDEKYYLSDDAVQSLIRHKARNEEKGNGFGWCPTDGGGIANCIKTESGYRPDSNFVFTDCSSREREREGRASAADTDGQYQSERKWMHGQGISQSRYSTDINDMVRGRCKGADGIYLHASEKFSRGPIKDLSRTLKATKDDAGVIIYE